MLSLLKQLHIFFCVVYWIALWSQLPTSYVDDVDELAELLEASKPAADPRVLQAWILIHCTVLWNVVLCQVDLGVNARLMQQHLTRTTGKVLTIKDTQHAGSSNTTPAWCHGHSRRCSNGASNMMGKYKGTYGLIITASSSWPSSTNFWCRGPVTSAGIQFPQCAADATHNNHCRVCWEKHNGCKQSHPDVRDKDNSHQLYKTKMWCSACREYIYESR